MMKIKHLSTLLLICPLLIVNDAFGLRCGNRIVEIGERKFEVIMKCGPPSSVEKWQEEVLGYENHREHIKKITYSYIEEWTYNLGSDRFMQFLKFRNGVLNSIESGGYGY